MASFIKTKRDSDKLVYDGHTYFKHSTASQNRIYWGCILRRKIKCRGFAVTDANNAVTVTNQHTHGPTYDPVTNSSTTHLDGMEVRVYFHIQN
jgi:hypothetical protein